MTIPPKELQTIDRTATFCGNVMKELMDRHETRGDTYLDMTFEELHTMLSDRVRRLKYGVEVVANCIKHGERLELVQRMRSDLIGLGGYAALLDAKVEEELTKAGLSAPPSEAL